MKSFCFLFDDRNFNPFPFALSDEIFTAFERTSPFPLRLSGFFFLRIFQHLSKPLVDLVFLFSRSPSVQLLALLPPYSPLSIVLDPPETRFTLALVPRSSRDTSPLPFAIPFFVFPPSCPSFFLPFDVNPQDFP